jgi:hypothetical protein
MTFWRESHERTRRWDERTSTTSLPAHGRAQREGHRPAPYKSGAALRRERPKARPDARSCTLCTASTAARRFAPCSRTRPAPYKSGADLRANGSKLGRRPQPYLGYGEDRRPTIRAVQPDPPRTVQERSRPPSERLEARPATAAVRGVRRGPPPDDSGRAAGGLRSDQKPVMPKSSRTILAIPPPVAEFSGRRSVAMLRTSSGAWPMAKA